MDDARMMSCLRSVMIHANLRNQLHMASRWGHSDRASEETAEKTEAIPVVRIVCASLEMKDATYIYTRTTGELCVHR